MTPSFIGRIAMMFPGVRPSISFASLPTASTFPVFWLIATMEGSLTTIPLPLAKTIVLAVPRSIARSLENRLRRERGDQGIMGLLTGLTVNVRTRAPRRIGMKDAGSAGDPFDNGCDSHPWRHRPRATARRHRVPPGHTGRTCPSARDRHRPRATARRRRLPPGHTRRTCPSARDRHQPRATARRLHAVLPASLHVHLIFQQLYDNGGHTPCS